MIENGDAQGPFLDRLRTRIELLSRLPSGPLGLTRPMRVQAHIAWDPGALPLARRLAQGAERTLASPPGYLAARVRSQPPAGRACLPWPRGAKQYDIPGNVSNLSKTAERLTPHRDASTCRSTPRCTNGNRPGGLLPAIRPAIVTVHSFTPSLLRKVAGTSNSASSTTPTTAFARAVLCRGQGAATGLDCRLNEPYSAADGVTHTAQAACDTLRASRT